MHLQPRTGNVGEYTVPLTALLWWGNNTLTKQAQLAHNGEAFTSLARTAHSAKGLERARLGSPRRCKCLSK